ncbi:MAG: alpha/beta hydrolase [Cytophagales bacterium]|jgi:pimeloyl-ACP methyl ester carboxylesterase|nr:alpha/beta hydrolase [Cytophagales bacterium]
MANLAYTSHGTGSPVVFLHGFCENQAVWLDFAQPFAADFQSVLVDLPGFGESATNPNHSSVEAMAAEVWKLLDELGLRQPVLVAHSLGGYVALAMAEQQPGCLAGLCLFHSTAYADSAEKKQSRDKTAAFIQNNGLAPFLDNFVPGLFYRPRHAELQAAIHDVRQLTSKTPVETAVAATLAMRDRPDRTHVLREAAYPILFIAGKNDEAVVFDTAKEQFSLPRHAITQILAETAHMGMFERPAETQAMVRAFVRIAGHSRVP